MHPQATDGEGKIGRERMSLVGGTGDVKKMRKSIEACTNLGGSV